MKFILDIILIVIFLICIFAGYKKGFVKSLMDLASNIIALIAARILSVSFAPQVYSNYFEKGIAEKLGERVSELGSSASAQVQSALDSVPKLSGFLSVAGIDESQVTQNVSDSINNGGADIVEALMTNLVSPLATFVIRILIFVAAFAVCVLVLKLLTKILDSVLKLPLLKEANKAFGFLFGAVKGLIAVAVICAAAQLLAGFIGSETLSGIVSDSVIVSVFSQITGAVI